MQLQGVPDGYLERNISASTVLLAMAVAVGALALYVLPSVVGRRSPKARSIVWLNLLLGWTGVGWVLAMLWALKTNDRGAKR
jgi:hypothetical protein